MKTRSSDITVYTALTGDKDELVRQTRLDGSPYVAFVNHYNQFKDDRRNSRIQKILAHRYISTPYSIYVDANIKLLCSPVNLVEKYLKDYDLMVFTHPTRDCIYDEAITCAKRGLDDLETIISQVKRYEDEGYGKHKGLCECGVIIRRHTKDVEVFNNIWWAEYCAGSRRDQISFMYAIDRAQLPFKAVPEHFLSVDKGMRGIRPNLFEIYPHKHDK